MENEIISYIEMCRREASSLQRGMNFDLREDYSVILMSVHPNAPYRDRFEDDGSTVIYEGHDAPRSHDLPDPKKLDQPERTPSGMVTENGKSIVPHSNARARVPLPGRSGYTKRSAQESGLTTAFSTWWTPGANEMASAWSSSSS